MILKKLPLYQFSWDGFLALLLGMTIPAVAMSFGDVFWALLGKENLQQNDWFLISSNAIMWLSAIFAFDFFVCRPQTKMPLNFNFELKDVKTYGLIFPMMFGMMLIAEFFVSLIPTKGFFFGIMYEWYLEVMEKIDLNIGVAILMAVICAPIFEEIVFRGIIQKGLINKGIKPINAIWISAIAFGIIHGNPWQLIGATLLGYVLGLVYHQTKSLLLPMLLHFFNNLLATLTMYFLGSESFAELLGISEYLMLVIGIILFFGFHYLFLKKYLTKH